MNEQLQHNIEDLFERMGSVQIPEDTGHRYALRRKILCSKQFEKTTAQDHKKIFLLIVPFFASGFIVMVLMVSSTSAVSSTFKEEPSKVSFVPVIQSEQIADEIVSPSFSTDNRVSPYIDERPLVSMSRDPNRVMRHMADALSAQ